MKVFMIYFVILIYGLFFRKIGSVKKNRGNDLAMSYVKTQRLWRQSKTLD